MILRSLKIFKYYINTFIFHILPWGLEFRAAPLPASLATGEDQKWTFIDFSVCFLPLTHSRTVLVSQVVGRWFCVGKFVEPWFRLDQ